jgi:peptidoglycan/LPS O-acetylase OafA/YrhL
MPPLKSTETNAAKKHRLDVWHVSPSVNRDYDFIDGLRGIAILMVVVGHHIYFNPKSGAFVHNVAGIFSVGGHGVTLFFALSGFLISWPFWKLKVKESKQVLPAGYGWRRFWKIYPPLALSILLLTPVYIFFTADWSYVSIAGKWLAGLPFFMPVSGKLNPVMWTLVIEVQFYILLPLLFVSFKRVPPKVCLWLLTLLFLLVPFSVRIMTGFSPTFQPDINSFFPSALDSFCAGIFVAGLENMGILEKKWARLGSVGIILWILSLLVIAWLNIHPENRTFAINETIEDLSKIAAGCLLFFVADPRHPVARLLCAPWLRWCGIISYEWYLFHQPIFGWARQSFGPAGGNVFKYATIVGGSFLIGLIVAALVYRFFSLPILKYGRAKHQPSHSR